MARLRATAAGGAKRVLDGGEHGVTIRQVGTHGSFLTRRSAAIRPKRSEGSLWSGRRVSSPYNLVCGEPCEGSTMMQSCASATGSGAAGPFYKTGTTARVGIGAPPPRIVWARHRHGR